MYYASSVLLSTLQILLAPIPVVQQRHPSTKYIFQRRTRISSGWGKREPLAMTMTARAIREFDLKPVDTELVVHKSFWGGLSRKRKGQQSDVPVSLRAGVVYEAIHSISYSWRHFRYSRRRSPMSLPVWPHLYSVRASSWAGVISPS